VSGEPPAGVLCVGTVVVDVGKVIDAYPAVEHLAMIESVSLSTGGPGLNLAVDLRRLGAGFPVGIAGAVGEDAHGDFVLDACAAAGVDTGRVRRIPGVATSFTDAMVERDGGRRTFFHHPGANDLLDPTGLDLDRVGARILHVGAPGVHRLLDTASPDGAGNGWSALLAQGRAAGLHTNLEMVTLDAGRERELVLPCLPHVDSIVVNELEAGSLTGIEAPVGSADGPVDWPALEAMARGLIAAGVHRLAVVHFPAGCVAATPDGALHRQGSVRGLVVSTTGAGDAFAAGVVLGLHEGRGVGDCLRLGAASAAACVTSASTSGGVVPARDCLAAAQQWGFRATG